MIVLVQIKISVLVFRSWIYCFFIYELVLILLSWNWMASVYNPEVYNL